MKVSDIMTKDVVAVSPDDLVSDIARLLTAQKIHGVPVVDKSGRVLGIITETDFFTKGNDGLYIPSFIDLMQKNKLFKAAPLRKRGELKKILKASAKDIMTKGCITINPDADVKDLLKLLRDKNLHTVPVVDNSGVLCGIVTLADMIALVKTQ